MKFLVFACFAKSGWMLGVKVYGSLVTAYRSLTHLPWRPTESNSVGINLLSGESLVQSSLPWVKTADNGTRLSTYGQTEKVYCHLKLLFAKEDKLIENCQGKLLDCLYIKDYGVDSVAIRLCTCAFKLLKGNCFFGDGKWVWGKSYRTLSRKVYLIYTTILFLFLRT